MYTGKGRCGAASLHVIKYVLCMDVVLVKYQHCTQNNNLLHLIAHKLHHMFYEA